MKNKGTGVLKKNIFGYMAWQGLKVFLSTIQDVYIQKLWIFNVSKYGKEKEKAYLKWKLCQQNMFSKAVTHNIITYW